MRPSEKTSVQRPLGVRSVEIGNEQGSGCAGLETQCIITLRSWFLGDNQRSEKCLILLT